MLIPLLIISAQASAAEPVEILITASRAPEEQAQSAASATVVDEKRIERLGDPLVAPLVRLTPSASVESGGPAGSLTQVRVRGAEANHTLLFIDGIRANDPAAGDIPRFELLNSDLVSRIEIVRGPQSALWGSDAIGGVVAVNGVAAPVTGVQAGAEAGTFGFLRASASGSLVSESTELSAGLGWQQADGVDTFSGTGERDGYRNLSARLRGTWSPAPLLQFGLAAFSLDGDSEFDGFEGFFRADTLDRTANRLSAARIWASAGDTDGGISGTAYASLLDSSNRNQLDDEEINRTRGKRRTAGVQAQYRFQAGALQHTAIVALDHDREEFHARDTVYFGASNQDRSRTHESITAEWRAESDRVVADVALRHDRFSAFPDTTTVRVSGLVHLGGGYSLAGSYSEGISQPTFFDLYGFFPGTFVGNPDLRPESSRGVEASLRYRRSGFEAALTAYRQVLHDEIVDVFDPMTFQSSAVNRDGRSRRWGVEAEAAWSPSEALRLSANYAYLSASEPGAVPGDQLREIRRPRHSGSIAADGQVGRFTYGASLAYVGARTDTNFDVFPAARVRLRPYWLAGARIAYSVRPGLDLYVRGTNLLDERYQDVFGYRTEGRGLFAGIRLER